MGQRVWVVLVALAALLGFAFASVSTSDFVAHLDRQVHGIHCGFLFGLDTPDVSGASGCHVTLMSPYSSVFRDRIWGGIPISLPAMAVFAYIAFFALALLPLRLTGSPRATGFLLAATGLPLLTSIVMAWISLRELDAVCKLCIGIYVSSALAFVFALGLWARAFRLASAPPDERASGPSPRVAARNKRLDGSARDIEPIDPASASAGTTVPDDRGPPGDATLPDDPSRSMIGTADTIEASPEMLSVARGPRRLATASEMDRRIAEELAARKSSAAAPAARSFGWGAAALAFGLGVLFVLVPVLAYAANAPGFERYLGACGSLSQPADPGRVLIALGPQTRPIEVVEVLDPLCPACRGFERRFVNLPAAEQVSRRALLFPLDDRCNWMVDRAIHPGACAVSEAILCAGEDAEDVLAWAFENQEAIRSATDRNPEAAARMVREAFPALASCLGQPDVRARLNRALRWAVANQLPVLTPQVYVGGTRVCDADTDLGLDWTLARLLERARGEAAAAPGRGGSR